MTDPATEAFIAELLQEAGQHHHAAYIEADGVDPEWALWYAAYVQAKLWDGAGTLPSRSRLVYLLVAADRAYSAETPSEPWPRYYARRIAADLAA